MPTVSVEHYVIISEVAGVKREKIEVNGSTLGDLIEKLESRYGRRFRELVVKRKANALQSGVIVSINGIDARNIGGLNAKIRDGDIVTFLPPVAGG